MIFFQTNNSGEATNWTQTHNHFERPQYRAVVYRVADTNPTIEKTTGSGSQEQSSSGYDPQNKIGTVFNLILTKYYFFSLDIKAI